MSKGMIYIDQMKKRSAGNPDYRWHPEYIATTDHNECFNIWFNAGRSVAEFFVPKSGTTYARGLTLLAYGV